MQITYTAPGKIILSGEHAVVYGKPGLATAVNRLLSFTVSDQPVSKQSSSQAVNLIIKVVRDYLQANKITYPSKRFYYQIVSDVPIGRGMGSSAALSVTATAAFLRFFSGRQFDKETVNSLAYQGEKYFHRNPSGIDVSVSCYGGLIYFRKEFEFLKNISCLNFKIPTSIENKLFIIDSGKPLESTAEMVAKVGQLYNRKPHYVEAILSDIEKVTKQMTIALIKGDQDNFQKTLVDNQIQLEMLGVVSSSTKKLIERLTSFGVGKVTGAGGYKAGSGFILFYTNQSDKLTKYLKQHKLKFYKFNQHQNGVQRN